MAASPRPARRYLRPRGSERRHHRNIAIYDRFIINTSDDVYVFGLDAETGELAWETQIFDYTEISALHSSGPIIADGKAISGAVAAGPRRASSWRTTPAPGRSCGGAGRFRPRASRDGDRHPRQDRRGLYAGPRDRRVPLGDTHRHAERDQQHRRRHRDGHRERRGGLHRGGAGGLRLSHLARRQGLGGGAPTVRRPTCCTCHCATPARA